MENPIVQWFKQYRIIIIAGVVLIGSLIICSRFGFVTVVINEEVSQTEVNYQFTSAKNKKIEVKTPEKKIKKLLLSGNYDVFTKAEGKSSFDAIKIKGFFRNTTINTGLSPEKDRQFIGNNPGACMFYLQDTLYSINCPANFSSLKAHVAAQSNQPTYTSTTKNDFAGTFESIVYTPSKPVAILNPLSEDEGAFHTAFSFQGGVQTNQGIELTKLSPEKNYGYKSYKDGFVAYDYQYDEVILYPTLNDLGQSVKIEKNDSELEPNGVDTNNNVVLFAFSNNDEGGGNTQKIKGEFVVMTDGNIEKISYSRPFTSVKLCGDKNLCVLSNGKLHVYSINGSSLKELYSVNNVGSIEKHNSNLLVVINKDIISLDVATGHGYIIYSLGEYSYCGIQTIESKFILCVLNTENKKQALVVSNSENVDDAVDRQIGELLKLPEVTDVSVYKDYIFIVPELGRLVYDNSTNSFGYDQTKLSTAIQKINTEIDRLGINREKYKISITGTGQ